MRNPSCRWRVMRACLGCSYCGLSASFTVWPGCGWDSSWVIRMKLRHFQTWRGHGRFQGPRSRSGVQPLPMPVGALRQSRGCVAKSGAWISWPPRRGGRLWAGANCSGFMTPRMLSLPAVTLPGRVSGRVSFPIHRAGFALGCRAVPPNGRVLLRPCARIAYGVYPRSGRNARLCADLAA